MENYVRCVELTAEYADAFNRRDLASLARLLDREIISSSQRRQGVQIGRENVLRRVKTLWKTSEERNRHLTAHPAIVQLDEVAAHPCLVIFNHKKPMSAVVLEVGRNGLAYMLSVMVDREFIKKIRLLDKDRGKKSA